MSLLKVTFQLIPDGGKLHEGGKEYAKQEEQNVHRHRKSIEWQSQKLMSSLESKGTRIKWQEIRSWAVKERTYISCFRYTRYCDIFP